MSIPRFSVNNRVIVNLVLYATLIGGAYSAVTLVREMFPESRPRMISIVTRYPGATPLEVERGISERFEEAIKDIEHISKIQTTINEGQSRILVELTSAATDIDAKLNEFKNAIDAIPRDELPAEAELTQVSKHEPRLPVISVTIFGDKDEHSLKAIGRKLRDEILLLPNITSVVAGGIRKAEISVEVIPEKLIEYGVSMSDVAGAIRSANLDLPAGQIKNDEQNIAVRTIGETSDVDRIEETIIRTTPAGKLVRVRDLASVRDHFEDVDITARYNGKPCVDITVYKTGDQDAIDIAQHVKAYVAGKQHAAYDLPWGARLAEALGQHSSLSKVYEDAYNNPFPGDVQLEVHSNLAQYIEGRLQLLTENAVEGLVLVGLSLLLFLNWRVAFWAMVGVMFSIAGTAILMKLMGSSLNLISMFGLLIVMGILVDDAIIIGENIYSRVEAGQDPHEAAIHGAEEVQGPVVICVLTTMAAFAPLMFIEGQLGDFFKVLPVVAIFALGTSLVEALTMLPTHLSHTLKPQAPSRIRVARGKLASSEPRLSAREQQHAPRLLHASASAPAPGGTAWLTRLQRISGSGQILIDRVVMPAYNQVLRVAVAHRYVAFCCLAGTMLFTLGLVFTRDSNGNLAPGGRVPFVFVQKMDSETLLCDVRMPVGTPASHTGEALRIIEATLLDREAFPEVRNVFSLIGAAISADEGGVDATVHAHVAQLIIELAPSDQRTRTSDQLMTLFRERLGLPAGMESLRFTALQGGPAGAEIELEITGENQENLLATSERLQQHLRRYQGVHDVQDDFEQGRREIQLALLDSARPMGIHTQWLANEIRGAFFGLEARTLQRDREDVDIRVRFPEHRRRSVADLETMRVILPGGAAAPLVELARIEEGVGFTSLRRVNQRRCITVSADVDQAVTTADQVLADLSGTRAELLRDFPGLRIDYAGKKLESRKSLQSLNRDFWMALGIIYVLLASLFRSYAQPLVVMTAVPFAIIGAIWGHYLLGFPLTLLSLIGIVALTGVAVNDGVVMVEFINNERRAGQSLHEAVMTAGGRRLRAIFLTSTTTVIGTAPMLFEQSFQARFLIPMVISVSAGLLFCTVITLLAVPAFYMILEDLKRLPARIFRPTGIAAVTPA